MSYIIYKTIKSKDFETLHLKISIIRPILEIFLGGYGFKITNESDIADILGLDFIFNGDRYDGNIGFLFDDEDYNNFTFTFYVAKSFDENKKRYSKRVNIAEKVDLKYIEDNLSELLKESMEVFSNLKDEELTKIINLR